MQEERRQAYLPGWYHLESSAKIKKNTIYTFNFFGTSFIAVRKSSHHVSVFSAYCPHLGAHLGVGGTFKKDEITCPFHGWKYNALGKCTHIPYCDKIPKRAELDAFPIKELGSSIFMYFNPDAYSELPDEINKLSTVTFKKFANFSMENHFLQRLMGIAKTRFRFESFAPGIILLDSTLLMTATPTHAHTQSVAFHAVINTGWNPLKRFLHLKRIRKQSNLLLNTVNL